MNLLEKLSIWTSSAIFFLAAMAGSARAIPSPELVIGSAASLSQLFAMGTAALGGATVLGIRRGVLGAKVAKHLAIVLIALFGLLVLAVGGNIYQYRTAQAERLERVQATLTRPAQIRDVTLTETAFADQARSELGISTQDAADAVGGQTLFIDVRETAENATGSIPGAVHIRFPDIVSHLDGFADQRVVLFCHNGNRSSETCARLAALGIDCRFIVGGIEKWIVEGRSFTDHSVRGLGDIRAIPDYPGKSVLLDTRQFRERLEGGNVQLIDLRYPGDFETGHLPGAINIPLRALPTNDLNQRISALPDIPVIAPCYDRRGCFMAQVLGYELQQVGIEFIGRYTLPWEYFEPPAPKSHVAAWLAAQNESYWSKAVGRVATLLDRGAEALGVGLALLVLAFGSRVLVMPIAIKAERDQLRMAALAPELDAIKSKYSHDPAARAAVLARFNRDHGLSPWRNLLSLVFLPVTMLGVAAIKRAAQGWPDTAWYAQPVVANGLIATVGLLSAVYVHLAMAKTRRGVVLSYTLTGPAIIGLCLGLGAAAVLYVAMALGLLLVQRLVVTGRVKRGYRLVKALLIQFWSQRVRMGALPLSAPGLLRQSGNKAFRLALLRRKGFPVPDGVVLGPDTLMRFSRAGPRARRRLIMWIARSLKATTFAVRSSAEGEDGADKSFAGVFESRLDVSRDELERAIEDVWSSFGAEHAGSYQSDAGAANILIQPMIVADQAGVMFTRAPDAPGQVLVEYVQGAGEALVSGRVVPEACRFGRLSRLPVGDEAPFNLAPLLELGRDIENVFSRPQDIEWVRQGGRYLVVQTRDVTQTVSDDAAIVASEWIRTVDRFVGAPVDEPILVRDEHAEVLPRPTRLSLDYMRALWAAGGSVERACASLNLRYRPPVPGAPFLVRVFGRLYVDQTLRARSGAVLTARARLAFDRAPQAIADHYRDQFLPELDARIVRLVALDFAALPEDALRREIVALFDEFITEIHVEAERVNIAAGYYMDRARAECVAAGLDPAVFLGGSGLGDVRPKAFGCDRKTAMKWFGHRALFDYELSVPRFSEDDNGFEALLSALPMAPRVERSDLPPGLAQTVIERAVLYQSLKEGAKNQTLRFLAELRRALVELDRKWSYGGLVFELCLDELRDFLRSSEDLRPRASLRAAHREVLLAQPSLPAQLAMSDLEAASGGSGSTRRPGGLVGTLVSGAGDVQGRAYVVDRAHAEHGLELSGFLDGDILVCAFLHPTWLPHVLRASGLITELGGWLSHMAIIAREHGIPLCTNVSGWSQIKTGAQVRIEVDGRVVPTEDAPKDHVLGRSETRSSEGRQRNNKALLPVPLTKKGARAFGGP